jgi:carboxyl-terminal processing protease
MLQAIDDPYASYLSPRDRAFQSEEFKGQFEGIGAEVTMRNGQVIIISPIAGSPAERAGIKAGDTILAVNGESIMGLTLLEVITKIRGQRGTPVELTIRHLKDGKTKKVTIIRDTIKVRTVRWETLENNVALIRIRTFTEFTDEDLAQILRKVRQQKAQGIVLDLRDNPGGLLETVVNVASQFLKEGLVLYEINAQGQRRDWEVRRGGLATDTPLVVLVNQFSASGSELLAGAIKAQGRAKIVGTKTFGKGGVNILQTLTDGSGIYFSIARWYLPDGTLLEGNGLEPDVRVDEEIGKDAPLEKALEILTGIRTASG